MAPVDVLKDVQGASDENEADTRVGDDVDEYPKR